MTKTLHTPGPWRATPHGERISIDAPDANYLGVARLNTTGSPALGIPNAQSRANARLISAAPELLAALEQMLTAYAPKADWSNPDQLHSAVRAAGEAIKKAKG